MSEEVCLKQYWLDKYRPQYLDQIHGNQDSVKYFKKIIKSKSIRHMIFQGPSGVGKTTSALCIAREYLKQDFKQAFVQFNASQQRTARFVYEKVYRFAHKKINLPPNKLKICLLDQSDNMLKQAHVALLKLIANTKDLIIIMSCNRVEYIHQSIVQRCKVVHFGELLPENVTSCVKEICDIENVRITEKAMQSLVFISGGDMRIAINYLQVCQHYSEGQQINQMMVEHVCDTPSIDELRAILKLAIQGNIRQAMLRMHQVIAQGHSIQDINRLLSKLVRQLQAIIPNHAYEEILKAMAFQLRKSSNLKTEIQLAGFLAKVSRVRQLI